MDNLSEREFVVGKKNRTSNMSCGAIRVALNSLKGS